MTSKYQAILLSAVLLTLTAPDVSRAVPYATEVSNTGGVVTFRLNENADNVKIISSAGAVTNNLGAGVKGLTVTNLGIAAGVIKVVVLRSAAPGYTQTSSDSFQDGNGVYVNKFEQARGIAVNKNPGTPSFGRIYIANARGQANTASPVRTVYQGIYMINPDDTAALDTALAPRTAGLAFTAGSTSSPLRLTVGKDDNLLYMSDFSDPSGGLWVSDLDVATNSFATNVFAGIGDLGFGSTTHGSIYAMAVEGSTAAGNLTVYTVDEDLSPVRSVWRYDVGNNAFPYTGAQVGPLSTNGVSNTAAKLLKGGTNNYLYVSQNVSAGLLGPSIRVFTKNGVEVTNSLDASRTFSGNPAAADILRNTTSMDLSADGKTLALLRGAQFGSVLLVPLLTNGLFDFAGTNSFPIGTSGSSDNNRDIAFDAAGNLYVINTATEWFRIYSRGGSTVATTGTDGSFDISTPPLLVSAAATVATANEQGPVNGQFTISRSGSLAAPLTVSYTVTGSATPVADYTALPGTVTLAAGALSTNIVVTVVNDTQAELTETVTLTITGSPDYGVGVASATVSILDNESPEISIALAQDESRLLEGYSASKLGYVVTRKGLLTPALTVKLAYAGGAAPGVRFVAPSTNFFGSGTATVAFNVTPINDDIYQGNQTDSISIAAGTGYAIGASNAAPLIVIDDEYPPGQILFADNFATNSADYWVTNSADGWVDSAVDFAFDYSSLFIPPPPGQTNTTGVRFRLNELAGSPQNSVSMSPLGLNLTGNYRIKFNVWVNYNGPMLDGGSGSTMHFMAGVGTTGDHANLASSGVSDGVWFGTDGDGGSTFLAGDVDAYIATALQDDNSGVYAETNTNPRSTVNPYYTIWGGIPAPAAQLANYPGQTGTSQPGNMGMAWHTMVITKAATNVVWTMDGIVIANVPTDGVTFGPNVFVGYQDLFPGASGNPIMSFAVVDNFRVETAVSAPIIITKIAIVGSNVEITFSGPPEAAPGDFALQGAGIVNGAFVADNTASLSAQGAGLFKATTAIGGANHFYRISQ